MNHSHNAHQHIHHHVHSQPMLPSHPPPPVGMNVGPQPGPPPPPHQQQHHIPNIPHYSNQKPYINPMMREQRMKQPQSVQKNRSHNAHNAHTGPNGLVILSLPPGQNQPPPHHQQQTSQSQARHPQSNAPSQQHLLSHMQKKPFKSTQHNNITLTQNTTSVPAKTAVITPMSHLHSKTAHQPPPKQQPQQQPPPQVQAPPQLQSTQHPPVIPQQPAQPSSSGQQQTQQQQKLVLQQQKIIPPKQMPLPTQPQKQQPNHVGQMKQQNQPNLAIAINPPLQIAENQIKIQQRPQPQQQPQQQQTQQPNPSNSAESKSTDILSNIIYQSPLATENLANIKEKTPMCLVNELARYNKIQHQYRLTGEQGPAHSKRFTVTLRLGEEEYTADGPSIKKAQHSAAADAISQTKYNHPPAKTNRIKSTGKAGVGNITPTVELNALAMKLGEPTVYLLETPHNGNKLVNPTIIGNGTTLQPHANGNGATSQQILGPGPSQLQQNVIPMNGQPNQKYYPDPQFRNFNQNMNIYQTPRFRSRGIPRTFNKCNPHQILAFNGVQQGISKEPCRITLMVGNRKFLGIGITLQAARHDAASRALEVLRPLASVEDQPQAIPEGDEDPNSDLKSPISLVHEIALKRNFTVSFEVQSEKGPPHMKTFITACKVGTIVTQGEGNGKKISKKRAAEKMLEELKKLPPMSPQQSPAAINAKVKNMKRKPPPIKKKTRNLIKEKTEPEYPEEVNPISKLIQIQQALKEREPVYTVLEERGAPRRREFVIEVAAGGQTARGIGPNKKMAKRIAAENLLILMGITLHSSSDKENNPKSSTSSATKPHKVTFKDSADPTPVASSAVATAPQIPTTSSSQSGSAGRQIVPGLLLMQQVKSQTPLSTPKNQIKQRTTNKEERTSSPPISNNEASGGLNTPTQGANGSTSPVSSPGSVDGARPKDHLLYLAKILGFQVQFSDYPKGNHGEYLTIVTLSTEPPQLCHGAGVNTEASQDEAAATALKILRELGLDNVKPKKVTNYSTIN